MGEHLTTGWEPGLPASDSLLRRYVQTNVDLAAHAALSAGGRVAGWDDLAVADARSAVVFDNLALLLQPPDSSRVTDLMARLLDFYPAYRHFVLLSPFPTPDLSAHGLELMGHPPLMLRPAGGLAPALPDGLQIVPVTGADLLRQFVDALVEGFPMPEADQTAMAGEAFLDGPVRLFLGLVDGVPVATSGARLAHGIADVEWVSTVPAHRGKGYGSALTWAATLAEPRWPAVLVASDAGQPVYEAMGYLRLLRLTLWHRPPVA
jgi:hypothetical protein